MGETMIREHFRKYWNRWLVAFGVSPALAFGVYYAITDIDRPYNMVRPLSHDELVTALVGTGLACTSIIIFMLTENLIYRGPLNDQRAYATHERRILAKVGLWTGLAITAVAFCIMPPFSFFAAPILGITILCWNMVVTFDQAFWLGVLTQMIVVSAALRLLVYLVVQRQTAQLAFIQ